jgi:hypothetical protein
MQHTAHHVNRRIPLTVGRVAALSGTAYGNQIIVEPWRFTAVGKTLARCKLYDYENYRWLNPGSADDRSASGYARIPGRGPPEQPRFEPRARRAATLTAARPSP